MSYDKQRFREINAMSVGELVHTMLVEFNRAKIGDDSCEGAFLQSPAYGWAADRLDELYYR